MYHLSALGSPTVYMLVPTLANTFALSLVAISTIYYCLDACMCGDVVTTCICVSNGYVPITVFTLSYKTLIKS